MSVEIIPIGNIIYGNYQSGFAGNIINPKGLCFAISTMGGGVTDNQ